MKAFTERYTWDEFQLIEKVRKVMCHKNRNRFGGNYEPYQVMADSSSNYRLWCSAIINKEEASIILNIKTLKLEFAMQVWEIAQAMTIHKYWHYLKHDWIKGNDPIKELVLTGEQRQEAEKYFQQKLMEICQDEKLMVSEGATFRGCKDDLYRPDKLILDVCLNENELTKEITDKIHYQFSRNEKHYPLDQKNIRFTYEDIKDYFVYLDVHLLSLLNAEDGVKDITAAEKALLDSAERLNLDGILKAVSDGANINAIDDMGETAITKVIRASRYDFHPLADKEAFEKFQRETPEFTNEEKIMVAQKLLDMGADINFFGPSGINGLLETTYNHNPVLMKFLLDKGANPNFNYHPEDGMEWIKSDPLYNVMGDYCCYDGDEKTLEEMEALLRNAGAKN
jgi:hypothetical protein